MPEYIEREALIENLKRFAPEHFGELTEMLIMKQPAADVAPVVHGEWEDKQNPQWKAYDIRHCGVCGWNIPKSKLRIKDLHWNYCPMCGAKMDGGKK